MKGHRQTRPIPIKSEKHLSLHPQHLLSSKSLKYQQARNIDRDIKSKSKPKLTQCGDYKKPPRKRQFKKIIPLAKQKQQVVHERLQPHLQEKQMQKFLASQANTASADSDDEFWLKETDLKDQEKLAKAMIDYIVENRIIRDEQYDDLFERIVKKYPYAESLVKDTLLEIVAYLDA